MVGLVMLALLVAVQPGPAGAASIPAPKPISPAHEQTVEQPEFQWSNDPNATSYDLQIALDHRFATVWRTVTTPANRHIPTDAIPAGAYWWRVRARWASGVSAFSTPQAFERRWSVAQEVARPDNVQVEDFQPATPQVEAPVNALKIWWEPVADASHYEVQFDGDPQKICVTSHTVLTPNAEPNRAQGASAATGGQPCPLKAVVGEGHWIRVRAVDVTAGAEPLYSLWSDQARELEEALPPTVAFTFLPQWVGTNDLTPAQQTAPRNTQISADAPVMQWKPVADSARYRVVIARDRDFTHVVGDWLTANTRFIPTDALWDHSAMRSYYWMVLPCPIPDDARCLNEREAVNRKGQFGWFRKQIMELTPQNSDRNDTAWTAFRWRSSSHTRGMQGSSTTSVPGLNWYEVQYKRRGTKTWMATATTDVTSWLSEALPFDAELLWRVRAVDGTGEPHPWSEIVTTHTPVAVPQIPSHIRTARSSDRLTVSWSPAAAQYFAVAGYTLWYSANGKRWRSIARTAGTSVKLRLGSQRKFLLRVSAHNVAGESRPSALARVR